MKTMFSRLLLTAIVAASFTALPACPEEKKVEVEAPPPPPPPPPTPPAPAAVVVPDYNPTGEDAEWRKQGAANLTVDNAAMEAAKAEGMLDGAIKGLEDAKAAAPAKK